MPDLREVFEMTTKQMGEPDLDSWREQEKRQRRSSRNKRIGAFAVAAAIGIVALVVVIRAGDEGAGTQPGGQGTDTNGIPTEQAIPPLPSGALDPGRYVFASSDPGLDASHRITIEVPDGYVGFDGVAALEPGTNLVETDHHEAAVITLAISGVYADPCHWKGTLLDGSAVSSNDDVVAALANQKGLSVSTSTGVTVDGFAGTYMERRVQTRISGDNEGNFPGSPCDGAKTPEQAPVFKVYRSPGFGDRLLRPGQLQQLWILDVDGVPLVIDALVNSRTSAQVRAELLQMVESIQIDPREEG
jgi:hypothetical protein